MAGTCASFVCFHTRECLSTDCGEVVNMVIVSWRFPLCTQNVCIIQHQALLLWSLLLLKTRFKTPSNESNLPQGRLKLIPSPVDKRLMCTVGMTQITMGKVHPDLFHCFYEVK